MGKFKHLSTTLTALLLLCASQCAAGNNVLRGRCATVCAPAGVSYDARLSANSAMDVFRDSSSGLLFALGSQSRRNGNAAQLASALGRRLGVAAQPVATDGVKVYTIIANSRMYALADCRDGNSVAVLMVLGNFTPSQALGYARSLKPRC